ncbi:DUF928 domain-containing protein [Chitinophaga oryzae]|uniref:DUF928 domain-containing protein n=1 Tax=Chitinophaga oryzae TaxID=2725414 RepID=A0AAE6ZQ78_9BACT|nr:DUF928 domain-containing protein [Chitinophaga oryzae]QJB35660.1 DUF928 domain-containing protein [Chitinophaga oryzae]QJB42199.1 DUF928 domain-containing protein [Chitinophaga oryzae]
MRKFCIGLLLMILLGQIQAKAQVSFAFMPEVQGRTLDGLLQVRVGGQAAGGQDVVLTITVTAKPVGTVVSIKTPAFRLMPGLNALPPGLLSGADIRFGNNRIADMCRQSGYFTEAEYEYCFEIADAGKGNSAPVLGEQCFDYMLQPFSPLILAAPADEDVICDKRPTFFWQPLLPAVPGMQYRLILSEVKPGQAKAEALRYNMPLINQQFINMPMLFFPPAARELNEGKEYIWQVTAYRGDMLLATSEMWTFRVNCTDSSESRSAGSYRDIEDLALGNFYLAKGTLRFAVRNTYGPANLSYTISGITDPSARIRKLPAIRLKHGSNHILIDLSDNRGFKDGHYYQLELKLPDGGERKLRFIYKQETE